ncbi:hypothetical protein C8Q69DRAFT_90444 [Paecilomyces variotii]|uniref:Uncharacterized protein n=1 Tax=Byssochlamys spectabilis TaxID=264951 RepID=A0A443HLS7_BYSSP|nr:hypothetical protein C8Q69DRAFT_90444 [Paecilomyces variotii]RWQ92759.1 hypothetical protein C8Q69DRAFT_90444 [Paecilomyces variotii]
MVPSTSSPLFLPCLHAYNFFHFYLFPFFLCMSIQGPMSVTTPTAYHSLSYSISMIWVIFTPCTVSRSFIGFESRAYSISGVFF